MTLDIYEKPEPIVNMNWISDDPGSHSGMFCDYAFDSKIQLPKGWWILTVVKGSAWVFMTSGNTVVHAGDTVAIFNINGGASISSLYSRGFAKFELVAV